MEFEKHMKKLTAVAVAVIVSMALFTPGALAESGLLSAGPVASLLAADEGATQSHSVRLAAVGEGSSCMIKDSELNLYSAGKYFYIDLVVSGDAFSAFGGNVTYDASRLAYDDAKTQAFIKSETDSTETVTVRPGSDGIIYVLRSGDTVTDENKIITRLYFTAKVAGRSQIDIEDVKIGDSDVTAELSDDDIIPCRLDITKAYAQVDPVLGADLQYSNGEYSVPLDGSFAVQLVAVGEDYDCADMTVSYDTEKLEYDKYESDAQACTVTKLADGKIRVMKNDSDQKSDSVIVKLWFTAKAKGEASVGFNEGMIGTGDSKTVFDADDLIGCTVNVKAKIIGTISGVQDVTGIKAPVKGENVDTSAMAVPEHTTATVKWSAGNEEFTGDTFAPETEYTVTITLTPEEGYIFAKGTTGKIDGEGSSSLHKDGTLVIKRTYPATEAKKLTSIAITTPPDKISYIEGQKFDPAGMVVTAYYDYGDPEVVTDYTLSPTEETALTPADKAVTVSYQGMTAEQQISVAARELASITIKSVPDKTAYIIGDEFDITGLAVTAVYNDGTSDDITADKLSVTGFDSSAYAESLTVTVEYAGKTATFTVSIDRKTVTAAEAFDFAAPSDLTYDGSAKVVTVSAKAPYNGTAEVKYMKDGVEVSEVKDAGVYDVYVSAAQTDIYKAIENTKIGSFAITEAAQTVSIAGITTCEYGDTNIKGTYAITSNGNAVKDGGAVTWSSSDETIAKVDASTGVVTVLKVGKVNITAKAAAVAGKYTAGEATVELVINKRTVKVSSVIAENKDYDGTTSAKLVFTLDGVVGNDEVSISADGVYDSAEAGERTVTISNVKFSDASGNYIFDESSVPASIKATIGKLAADTVKIGVNEEDLTQEQGSVKKPDVTVTPDVGEKTIKYFIKKPAADGQSDPIWEEWTEENIPSVGTNDIRIEVTSPNVEGAVTKDITLTVNRKSSGGGGGGGGGGSSASVDYTVTTAQSDGGVIKASASKAAADATVTVTATPDNGYTVSEVTVKMTSSGAKVTVTKNSDGTYSFKMPAGAVTVSASFVKGGADQPGTADEVCSPYGDINTSAWYHSGVHYVLSENIMNGTSANTFVPNGKLSRAMLAQILYNQAGKPAAGASNFSDVKSSDWYAQAVAWAAEKGVVTGFEDGTFRPNDYVTREQLAAMLYRHAGSPGVGSASLDSFNDAANVAVYAQDAMKWATAKGVITGNGNASTLDPKGNASRAQAAAMIMRYLESGK